MLDLFLTRKSIFGYWIPAFAIKWAIYCLIIWIKLIIITCLILIKLCYIYFINQIFTFYNKNLIKINSDELAWWMSTESKIPPRNFGFRTDRDARKDLRRRLIIKNCKIIWKKRRKSWQICLPQRWKRWHQVKEKFTDYSKTGVNITSNQRIWRAQNSLVTLCQAKRRWDSFHQNVNHFRC